MINKKEIVVLITSALVLGYIFDFPDFGWITWLASSVSALLILAVNTAGKKVTAHIYDSYVEIKHWDLTQFGFRKTERFKNPIPVWLFVPLVLVFITAGFIKWLAVTTFDTSAQASRARRAFAHVGEWDLAMIAVGGILFNIILAFLGQLTGATDFARINLMFALYSLIPFSNLDGAKIFFGSRLLWVFSVIFVLAMLLLFDLAGILATIVIALLIAIVVLVTYYYLIEK